MQAILKKNKTFILIIIFSLLICLCLAKQGNTFYKISIIMIVILNSLLINFKKIKDWFSLLLKKKINLLFIILLFIFFSKNLYSIQILISSLLAFILFFNFKNLDEKYKIKLVYFFSYYSIISYFFLCLVLIIVPEFTGNIYSKNSYILNFDTIANMNSYSLFNGINFNNLSLFYFGIFFLKLKFFRNCFNEFKNLFVISILLDFLLIINLGYNSIMIMVLLMSLILYLVSFMNVRYKNKVIFSLIVLLSFNFFYLTMILEKLFLFDFLLSFEKIKSLLDFLLNHEGKEISVDEIRSIGKEFIPLLGLFNRIFFYWSLEYEISILGSMNYNDFLSHSLFLEFLVNFGLVGLLILYLYLFKFFSLINSKYSKLFFLTVIGLNMMDTFLFTHHYQLMLTSWIFIGLLDERKKI